jgi:hypothetical protein
MTRPGRLSYHLTVCGRRPLLLPPIMVLRPSKTPVRQICLVGQVLNVDLGPIHTLFTRPDLPYLLFMPVGP